MTARRGFRSAPRSIGCLVLVVAALAPPAPALAREADSTVDLRTAPSWLVTGSSDIGPVGDVNGDGIDDVAVSDCGVREMAGEVRVVWGAVDSEEVSFENLGEGFSIQGAQPEDRACNLSTIPVGDVNGDGLHDVLVAAPLDYRPQPATVYVVFGKTDSETVRLEDFDAGTQGTSGYVVHKWNGWGIGVEGVGDMNEDGLADFAVGGQGGRKTYVVFGQVLTTPVDLQTFDLGIHANRGFVVTNRCRECIFGSVGDVNGDGVPDVGVGGVAWRRYEAPGSAYVVFGKADGAAVDTSRRTSQFFKIKGDEPAGLWDGAIAAAGDVNGDGLGDVILGVPKTYSCCHGKVAVIYGKTDLETVRLADLGSRGFQIFASEERDALGRSVAGVGDLNHDGFADVAMGADFSDYYDRGAGAVYVVYGSRNPSDLRTGRLKDDGYVIVGREWYDRTGYELGVAGDMSGDGVPDLMISAGSGGKTYLLWL